MKTNNIKISQADARVIYPLFKTEEWKAYMVIMNNAYKSSQTLLEDSPRDDLRLFQGTTRAFKEICNIENIVDSILSEGD